jgi:hypothetical protein
MFFLRRYAKFIALPMVAMMIAVTMPLGIAHAALVGTDQVVAPAKADADRARVVAFVAREDVRGELRKMGVDANEVERRVAVMSDIEIQQSAARMDQIPAGQSTIGVVVGAVLIIFIVLLVTDMLGLTDVFPFVKRNNGG